MHPLRYNALVASLEQTAAVSPEALRRRVKGLVALGYAYVLAVLLAVVAGIVLLGVAIYSAGAGGAVKLLIGLLILAWVIVKSLWVRATPPDGMVLAPGSAPLLERRVEEIRAALDAPRADTILLTDDFNASVTQIPRLGIFGWPRTYLTLGVPLMCGLDPRQLDAVLAHEFAHLSGAHPKLGLWVYRMSRTWQQLLTALSRRPAGRFVFAGFFRWYVPRLQAYGFVMSHRDEYDADAEAASLCGADAMAQALVALEVRGRALGEHAWPEIWRGLEHAELPPARVWSDLTALLHRELPPATRAAWLGRALRRRTLDDDTHPSLADRLRALGVVSDGAPHVEDVAARLLPPVTVSSAEHYLGADAGNLLATLNDGWREHVREQWETSRSARRALRDRANELLARDAASPLEPAELWELTGAVTTLDGERAALPLLRRAVVGMPKFARPHFDLGRILLDADDPACITHLRRAMELDDDLRSAALELLRQHHANVSDRAALESVQVERHANAELLGGAAEERGKVVAADVLVSAALDADTAAGVREVAAAHPGITVIWVARKVTRAMPGRPLYVALVETNARWWNRSSKRDQQLAQQMADELYPVLGGDLLALVHQGTTRWLQKKMRGIAGARVYVAHEAGASAGVAVAGQTA